MTTLPKSKCKKKSYKRFLDLQEKVLWIFILTPNKNNQLMDLFHKTFFCVKMYLEYMNIFEGKPQTKGKSMLSRFQGLYSQHFILHNLRMGPLS